MEPARILVVDDEAAILRLLKEALTQWGYQVTGATSAAEALQALRGDMFDAVITDIRMPDMNGLELLKEIKRHDESVEVVVMTGYPTIASAVEALKVGAFDYLSKPLLLDELRHLMARMTERRFLRGEVHSLRARLGEELTVNELVGNSPPMQRVKEIIGRVAPTDSPVLIEGESGTGKELVAAAIHRLSPRARGPFIPVNCSAIPEDLLESEFFGHVRGAFSGAVSDTLGLFRGAHDGTIFLDEVAELSPGLQVKLLRVLQEMLVRPVGSTKAHAVDVRVIAASNRDLDRSIAEGRLRQDLYYRLNVVRVSLPQLRARREDIPALVNHFIRRFSRRFRREIRGIAPEHAHPPQLPVRPRRCGWHPPCRFRKACSGPRPLRPEQGRSRWAWDSPPARTRSGRPSAPRRWRAQGFRGRPLRWSCSSPPESRARIRCR